VIGQFAFISHSSYDRAFVERLARQLRSDDVWVDMWDMDVGDLLVTKIERAIETASEFILVLSGAALQSKWVKYESNMAIIRLLEDADFRIVVLRIDDCEVPLRFRPFLYVDAPNDPESAISQTQAFLSKRRSSEQGREILYRRQFVNRAEEVGLIEQYIGDPDVRIICINGFFGIGKTSLMKEAAIRLWRRPQLAIVELSPAHTGPRLCLELCALAGIDGPPDGASSEELTRASLLAVESLVADARVIVFNKFEGVLDEDGSPGREVSDVLLHLCEIPATSKTPIFVLSRRWPRFDGIPRQRIGDVRVAGLKTDYLVTILENEVSRIQRKDYPRAGPLVDLAKELYGYPLAGRLAAPLLTKYSPEYLLRNLRHVESLRTDIAEAILAQLDIGEGPSQVLEALALFDGALSPEALAVILSREIESVLESIDVLADHNLVDAEGSAVHLHPLITDFYWKRVRTGPNFKEYAKRLADFARRSLETCARGSTEYVSWLTHACRMLFLSGDLDGGKQLRADLRGELKRAAIDLYQRQEYDVCLRYCEEYLQSDTNDVEVLFHKARCLSRLERPLEAHAILDRLLSMPRLTNRRAARLNYAKGRTFFENRQLEEARNWFARALALSPDYLPALQGMAEVLVRTNMVNDAAAFLERALVASPMDSYALSLYADVLWRQGRPMEAIEKMGLAVKAQPENASFLFRMGRFHQESGSLESARDWFSKAKKADDTYSDVRLSLASVAIDLRRFGEAEAELAYLRPLLTGDKRRVLLNIEAELKFVQGKVDEANEIASRRLRERRDVATLGLMARIEMALSQNARERGLPVMADQHRQRAIELIDEGLSMEPDNPPLRNQRDNIERD